MRELFEICPKIQFLKSFWCFLSFEGSELDQRRCKILCSYVSGTTWKIPCLSPEKMTIFVHKALFSTCPSQNFGTPTHFKITVLKSTRIELSPHKVLF